MLRRKLNQSNLHDLYFSLIYGGLSTLNKYIENGGSLEIKGPGQESLLTGSIEENQAPIFYRLLQIGIDIDTINGSGGTPLHRAAETGCEDFVTELLFRGAKTDLVDKEGVTPLMLAVKKGHIQIVKRLIASECSLNQQDCDGYSALHLAAKKTDMDLVKVLLENGADATLRSDMGESAISLAILNKDLKVINLILNHDSLLSDGLTYSPDLRRGVERHYCDAVELMLSYAVDPLAVPEDAYAWTQVLTLGSGRRLRTCFMSEYGYLTSSSSRNKIMCFIFEYHMFLQWMGFFRLACQYGFRVHKFASVLKCKDKCLCRKIISDIQSQASGNNCLTMLCRTTIRECLGLGVVKKTQSLPLPSKMKRYLCFQGEYCLEKPLI